MALAVIEWYLPIPVSFLSILFAPPWNEASVRLWPINAGESLGPPGLAGLAGLGWAGLGWLG